MPILAQTYTPRQLNDGIVVTSFPPIGTLLMEFNNEDITGYFTIESITGINEFGRIPEETKDYAAGTYSSLVRLDEIGIIENPFKFSVCYPPGTSSMQYLANIVDVSGQCRLRGTGNCTLKIYRNP